MFSVYLRPWTLAKSLATATVPFITDLAECAANTRAADDLADDAVNTGAAQDVNDTMQ